ncbi:MAG: class III signal peptide-containing protein [Candidatus Anstonellaceae archaeon]
MVVIAQNNDANQKVLTNISVSITNAPKKHTLKLYVRFIIFIIFISNNKKRRENMFSFKKGQGATEYLVLLAVVLIVAMVAIALLGFFPGLASDAKINQSDAYWRGQASPFSVQEHARSAGSQNLVMVVQNNDANQKVLTNISISGTGVSTTYNTTTSERFFSGGERKTLTINLGANCTSGTVYEYTLSFLYTDATGTISKTQFGEKPLVGKCS